MKLIIQIFAAVLAFTAFTLFLSFILRVINEIVFWIGMGLIGLCAFVMIPYLRKKSGF
ncbi:MAG: hypothetical protein AABX51_03625 [Nanoarchaeota archaeon]